jgi:hypothetical protein
MDLRLLFDDGRKIDLRSGAQHGGLADLAATPIRAARKSQPARLLNALGQPPGREPNANLFDLTHVACRAYAPTGSAAIAHFSAVPVCPIAPATSGWPKWCDSIGALSNTFTLEGLVLRPSRAYAHFSTGMRGWN